MNWYCKRCRHVIVGTPICPACHRRSTTPHRSTTTIEEVEEAAAPQQGRKRALERDLGPAEVAEAPVVALRPPYPSSSYALAHTLGRCDFDPHGGDGAYSAWLQHFMAGHANPLGCVLAGRLEYEGPVGNIRNAQLARAFNPIFLPLFSEFLIQARQRPTNTIILNWHLRLTGTPNGWTGRGMNERLLARFYELTEAAGMRLLVVYTVHELTDLRGDVPGARALVALNPTVHRGLGGFFPTTRRALSRVPDLMTSLHTSSLDLILRFLDGDMPSIEALNMAGACLIQHLRLHNTYPPTARPTAAASVRHRALRAMQGVVIFGMISARHGVTPQSVAALCGALDAAGFPATFRVVIAGKEAEPHLVQQFQALVQAFPRLAVVGPIDSFNSLAGCRYAISFDEHGFRTNASAMVNVTRAGHALFSRQGAGEMDGQLIARAVGQMALAETRAAGPTALLAAQQPRYRIASSEAVGRELDQFFRDLADEQ
ncbi:MAG: hypothetical protein HOP28_18510 [Gemmatimonadales bacterium]|nr:hypothetical protein [Gemmatimonadales bacterium]